MMLLVIQYFSYPPATSSLLGLNILNSPFSNTLNLCSSLNVKDRTPHYIVTSLFCHWSIQLCTGFCRQIKYE